MFNAHVGQQERHRPDRQQEPIPTSVTQTLANATGGRQSAQATTADSPAKETTCERRASALRTATSIVRTFVMPTPGAAMNITSFQTTAVRRRMGAALMIGGLLAAVAAGPSSARPVAKRRPHQATAQHPRVAASADAGLNLALGSDYPTAAVSSSAPLANVRFQDTVASTAVAVGAPSTGDPGLGVLFGSTANEAAWASIRYSMNPGLSLVLSEMYPVK